MGDVIENKIEFMMTTDWMFHEPIDSEHKKYVLLAYFKKIDEILKENKIYPTFIELSLHLASLQTLIKENVILSTNKIFTSCDDEVLLKELIAESVPVLTIEEQVEVEKIIKDSSSKFFEYFSIVKSYWGLIYDSISFSIKRNSKNLSYPKGFIVYNKKSDNDIYVWEYRFTKLGSNFDEYSIKVDLIYHANKKDLTLNQIVENFSKFFEREKKTVPVFEFKSDKEYPIENTLLPLFKRKLLSHIFQTTKIGNTRKTH